MRLHSDKKIDILTCCISYAVSFPFVITAYTVTSRATSMSHSQWTQHPGFLECTKKGENIITFALRQSQISPPQSIGSAYPNMHWNTPLSNCTVAVVISWFILAAKLGHIITQNNNRNDFATILNLKDILSDKNFACISFKDLNIDPDLHDDIDPDLHDDFTKSLSAWNSIPDGHCVLYRIMVTCFKQYTKNKPSSHDIPRSPMSYSILRASTPLPTNNPKTNTRISWAAIASPSNISTKQTNQPPEQAFIDPSKNNDDSIQTNSHISYITEHLESFNIEQLMHIVVLGQRAQKCACTKIKADLEEIKAKRKDNEEKQQQLVQQTEKLTKQLKNIQEPT